MARRPDRSDENLSAEEAAKIEAEVRDYFDKVTPRRPIKPERSDPSDVDSDLIGSTNLDSIPELDKFRKLESQPHKLVVDGAEVVEEYVATQYYDEINYIDKQHHTTGTGFIKVHDTNDGSDFDVETVSYTTCANRACYKSNPAMNDWVPSANTFDEVIPVSTKPNRSES